jgi:ubiquitin-protein ligase
MKRSSSGKVKTSMRSELTAWLNGIARDPLEGNIAVSFDEDNMTKGTVFIPAKTLNTPITKFRTFANGSCIHIDAETAVALSKLLTKEETVVYYPVSDQLYRAEMRGNIMMQTNETTGMEREIQYDFLSQDVKGWFDMFDPQSEPGIYLEVRIPDQFPNEPPFVFLQKPRLEQYTAHVTVDGAICAEFLTTGSTSGAWRSTMTFKQFVDHILHYTLLDVSDTEKILRVDMTNKNAYAEEEARRSFRMQASIHAAKGWNA